MVGLLHTFSVYQIYGDIFLRGCLLEEHTLKSSFIEQSFRSQQVSNFKVKDCKHFKSSMLVILFLCVSNIS